MVQKLLFHESIEALSPKTEVQLCIVHIVRNSLRFVLWKDLENRASLPNGEVAVKLFYLFLKNIMKKRTISVRKWGTALDQFFVLYDARMPS